MCWLVLECMCCLKIGREFDTHLIALEMESEVSGIAASSGKVPLHLASVFSCSMAVRLQRQRPITQNIFPCSWQGLKLPGFCRWWMALFVKCDFSRIVGVWVQKRVLLVPTGQHNWKCVQSQEATEWGPQCDFIRIQPGWHCSQMLAAIYSCPHFFRVNFFPLCCYNPVEWHGPGYGCEHSSVIVWPPWQAQRSGTLQRWLSTHNEQWKSMGGKWSIFALLIFCWSLNPLRFMSPHHSVFFPVGHILMSVLCVRHGTASDSSLNHRALLVMTWVRWG